MGLGVWTRTSWLVFTLKESCGEAISFFPFPSSWETFCDLCFPPQKCQHDAGVAEHILCCDRYHLTPIYERHERDTSPPHDMNTLSPPTCNVFSFWESEESFKEEKSLHLEVLKNELINTLYTRRCPSVCLLLSSSDGAKVSNKEMQEKPPKITLKTTFCFWAIDLEFHLPADAADTSALKFPPPPFTRATASFQY